MTAMHSFTLGFKDSALEALYFAASLPRERLQGRTAIVVGVIVYLLYSVLDFRFVPEIHRSTIWLIRLTALTVPLSVFLLSNSRYFDRHRHWLLAMVGFAAGIGLIAMLSVLTVDSAINFYPGLVLATFYTYNFVGTRFIYAFGVDLSLLLIYNLVFGMIQDYPGWMLMSHDFFIVSANLIGGLAGYFNEQQRRLLFLRERELDEERHRHMTRALHDALTGLPNRELLGDRLETAMAMALREGELYSALFIDLDGFKAVNDSLGHETGDQVLQVISQRLKAAIRDSDTVARLGGDEFFVVARGIASEADASVLGNKLNAAISEPIPELPPNLALSASIGICMFPYEGMSAADIIRRADQAMYRAKLSGKDACIVADQSIVSISLINRCAVATI